MTFALFKKVTLGARQRELDLEGFRQNTCASPVFHPE